MKRPAARVAYERGSRLLPKTTAGTVINHEAAATAMSGLTKDFCGSSTERNLMKASIRRVLRTKEIRGDEWVQEWDDVELVERLEWLEAQREAREEPVAEAAAPRPRARGGAARTGPVAWWKLP